MIHKMQDEQTIQAQHQVSSNWWTTATPLELRMSANVVLEFLSKSHQKHCHSIESFSRALALKQLLDDNEAVRRAMLQAHLLIPNTLHIDSPSKVTPNIRHQIEKCEAIKEGFRLCLEYLKPHNDIQWLSEFENFIFSLAISKENIEHPVSRKPPDTTRIHL